MGKARASVLVFAALGVWVIACSSSSGGGNNDVPVNDPGTPGGPITVPVGTDCTDDSACGGGRCENNKCIPGARCVDDTGCPGARCVDGACIPLSATDGIKNGDETDVDCGGSVAPRCDVGLGCAAGTDCKEGVCGADGLCAAPAPNDGVKNGDETDVDCGGSSGNVCAEGKKCNLPAECDSKFCTNNVCEPRKAGRQDGDETDVDCGGIVAPGCASGQMCLVDADCQSQGCDTTKHCALSPSCKVLHGGTTCGTGEFPDGNKVHESCCKSLPVAGYSDPAQPGKTVYVDKYEITAGRMRAFVESTGGNVKNWISAHLPTRWNASWTQILPTGPHNSISFAIPNANTTFFPDDGIYHQTANHPTQGSTWFVWNGTYSQDVGYLISLGEPTLFPEFYANSDTPSARGPTEPPVSSGWEEYHYSANHASNCYNGILSEGWSTYWMSFADAKTVLAGTQGKYWSKDQMDEKALSCATYAMMAAFCAWDGGQLMTAEVSDYITGNTVSPVYYPGGANTTNYLQNGKLAAAGGYSECRGDGSITTYSDGGTPCSQKNPDNSPKMYYYPPNLSGQKFDGSNRVAAGGRHPADAITQTGAPAGTEPWMDMVGNLQEAVMKAGETARFDYRGMGIAYGSIWHHGMQEQLPRYKGASFGGRCMRFK